MSRYLIVCIFAGMLCSGCGFKQVPDDDPHPVATWWEKNKGEIADDVTLDVLIDALILSQ